MGNYTYEAPASWDVDEQIQDTRHHTLGTDIFYSVALITIPGDGDSAKYDAIIDSMARSIIKEPVFSSVTLDFGQTGYMAVGESSVSEGSAIYALYLMDSPGFLQIVYKNSGPGDAAQEFQLLISAFAPTKQENVTASSTDAQDFSALTLAELAELRNQIQLAMWENDE
jgi:hypothetical protein